MLNTQPLSNDRFKYSLTGLIILFLFLLISLNILNSFTSNKAENSFRIANRLELKPYLEKKFNQARWFPLIEDIEADNHNIILKTFIFPDYDGKELANEIINEFRTEGFDENIMVYGRDISYRLLASSNP